MSASPVPFGEVLWRANEMKADLDASRSMLLIGDLNHGPDTEEYKLWIDAGFVDTFRQGWQGGRADHQGRHSQVADRLRHGGWADCGSDCRIEGAFRLHIADKESFALSDHLPQLAVFQ